jgi:diguanylate cyclase (GGDEF)-like protein
VKRRVLVVADPGAATELLVRLLGEIDCAVQHVATSAEAVRRSDDEWDAVVIDAGVAGDDGYRPVRTLRTKLGRDVPIILATALGDVEARRRGLEHGADDFLVAPPTALEVGVRISQALRLRELSRELDAARDALALSALGDPSTGLYSPRALSDRLAAEHARARRYRRPLAVLVASVEQRGRGPELAGDHLLAAVGQGVRASLRQTDFLARSAVAELAVVAPETGAGDGVAMAERLLVELGRLGLAARVAFGVASSDDRLVVGPEDLLTRARAGLARTRGRGGVGTPP